MVLNAPHQPHCLIIEDQALIALSVEAYLEDMGCEVQIVTSLAQAYAWLENHTPEFVILDFMLRDGPATEFARGLRERGIPFVIYSGYSRHLGVPTVLEEVPWLEKPTRREDLLQALVTLLPEGSAIAGLNS